MNKTVHSYHPLLVLLHWALALVIVGSLCYGFFVLGPTTNADPSKVDLLRPHMAIGMAIGALTLLRLVVRIFTSKPQATTSAGAAQVRLAGAVHVGLYVIVLGMVASGFAIAIAAGLPDIVFARSGAPLPADFSRFTARTMHAVLGLALVALLALHVGAALVHQFVRRDAVIRRMWFGQRFEKE
ncbi:MAG: cytochrome b/b6 domain-containing protein [Ideonella sp.]|nr:cytochrome b/b6 domain-containing protein [Ideonella sp.]